jgi:dinuclear metal center YbgI/SA1388 family protein
MPMKVSHFLDIANRLAPFPLALDWDNSGLQTGNPEALADRVSLCLDPTLEAVSLAAKAGSSLLISHHPLIFKPLKRLSSADPVAAPLLLAARENLSVISLHTNWDAVGVAPALARVLELRPQGPLEPNPRRLLKLIAFIPQDYQEKVKESLFAAGAGTIGAYRECSFSSPGLGNFLPPENGRPFIGAPGERSQAEEIRLETIVEPSLRDQVTRALLESHPYEEPAFEFLEVMAPGPGFGLVGYWDPPREAVSFVKKALNLKALSYAGPRPGLVSRVALMPGSGGSYVEMAFKAGAEALITGDVSHHQALLAKDFGLTVISAGHFETERPSLEPLRESLLKEAKLIGESPEIGIIEQSSPWRHEISP